MPANIIQTGPLDLRDQPPASYGRTYRDFVVLLWIDSSWRGWTCAGLMHAPFVDLTGHFAVHHKLSSRRQAIDAGMDDAIWSIDRWYASVGL